MKTANRQSLSVGRDSVEPKLDFLGISQGSTESRPTFPRAFTLIELLAVIAIIGIIAAMVVGLSGLAARKKHDAAVTAMKNRLMLFISSYQSKMGFFPPDNTNNVMYFPGTSTNYEYYTGLNPLLYELTGATMTTNSSFIAFNGMNGTTNIPGSTFSIFYGRGGIANSLPDEIHVFFQPLPNPKDYVKINGLLQLVVPVPLTGAPNEINLWHYDCSNPNRHNSSGYDLWGEYSAGTDSQGNPIIITNGNW
jgi:prepilin-type N-terminal cleavage/methylation domain-containing protein